MPFDASTSLFSVASPFTKYFDPQGARAATEAPALLRSSPTTKSTAKFLTPSPSSFSAAATIAAMIPLASHAPRPQTNSASSREGKNGGTVAMCVASVTTGCPHEASTLYRPGSTSIRWARPSVRAASFARWSWRYAATGPSFSVIDSISTNARVSSYAFIGYLLWEWNETRRKDTREAPLVSSLLDSAPSILQRMTVDRPFGIFPNHPGSASGTISAGQGACKTLSPGPSKRRGRFG